MGDVHLKTYVSDRVSVLREGKGGGKKKERERGERRKGGGGEEEKSLITWF